MAECIVGDITPYCGVSKEEKHTKEKVRAIVVEAVLKLSLFIKQILCYPLILYGVLYVILV